MLNTRAMAQRLGMSPEGVRLKWRRHELLGLEVAKRGIRYPDWQLSGDGRVLPGLAPLSAVLGDDPWSVYRFLEQHHPELDGRKAGEVLADGDVERVAEVAENIATGTLA